ncbi:retrovirus-related pol polyprotein from transposon TNT 1-94 [Tanacetum coccineum]
MSPYSRKKDIGEGLYTLHAYFKEEGIEHQTFTPRTPEQNGIVERRNRTLVEAARTMLSAFKLPLSFWARVAKRMPTQNRSIIISIHGKTTYHIINDRKPSIKHLHIFGLHFRKGIVFTTSDDRLIVRPFISTFDGNQRNDVCFTQQFKPRTQRQRCLLENVSSGLGSSRTKGVRLWTTLTRGPKTQSCSYNRKLIRHNKGLEISLQSFTDSIFQSSTGLAEDTTNDQAPNNIF